METSSAGTEADSEGAEERFARRVRFEREARALSQADLAKLLNKRGVRVHPTTVAKIESRDGDRPRSIRLDEAVAISDVFNIPLDELLGRATEVDRESTVARVHIAAIQTLAAVRSALVPIEQALDALKIEDHLEQLRDLAEQGLVEDITVDPTTQRALLMALSRGRLGNALGAMGEALGEIGSYANMDQTEVRSRLLDMTTVLEPRNASRPGNHADPS